MKTEFLQGLEISEENIQKILAENGKDIEKFKNDNEVLKLKVKDTEKLLADANNEIESYKKMDVESIQKSADSWKAKYEDLEKQKADEEYERKIDEYLGAFEINDEVHAEKIKSLIKEKELKFDDKDDKKLIGGDDVVNSYKEKYPHVFGGEQKLKGVKVITGAEKKETNTVSEGSNFAKAMNESERTQESKFFN